MGNKKFFFVVLGAPRGEKSFGLGTELLEK